MNSTVKDVMSTHVIAVRQGAPYKEMAAMMHDQRVSTFPVIDDDNKVTGVVSEADLLTKEALEGTVPRTLRPAPGLKALPCCRENAEDRKG
jgi:CBS-domain-containing membrane protein